VQEIISITSELMKHCENERHLHFHASFPMMIHMTEMSANEQQSANAVRTETIAADLQLLSDALFLSICSQKLNPHHILCQILISWRYTGWPKKVSLSRITSSS